MTGFPKPARRSAVKRKAAQAKLLSRVQCRLLVLRRAGWKCERCQRPITDDCWPHEDQRAHVNEKVPRSLGGNPMDPDNGEALCRKCHLPGGEHAPTAERMRQIQARLRKTG